MRKLTVIQIALGTFAGAALVTTGAIAGLKYWTGSDFSPSGSSRELKSNQVLFQQEPDPQATNGNDGQEDSSRWEKQEDSTRQEGPQLGEGNFLFQTNDGQIPDATTGGVLSPDAPSGDTQPGGLPPDQIFTPVDGDNSGNNGGSGIPGTGGDENGDKPEEKPTTPTTPDLPHVPAGDPMDKPATGDNGYQEAPGETGENMHMAASAGSDRMYSGQKLDDYGIFCRLNISFIKFSDDEIEFSDLGQEHYGTYFRIASISFDGGKTWITDFPITVPENASNIVIHMKYRYTQNGEWQEENLEYGAAEKGVLYVLSQLPEEGEERLNTSIILNYDTIAGCNPAPGTSYNLLELVNNQLLVDGSGNTDLSNLNCLFLGWQEDGTAVPWLYPMTSGRHVLLPLGFTPVPEGWQVQSKFYWLNPEGMYQDVLNSASILCYVQTAVGAPTEGGVVTVPRYIQGVDLDTVSADTLHLSDTVFLVAGNSGNIHSGFTVEVENPYFSADTTGPLAGVLLSKDRTAVYAVPGACQSLALPDTVKNVYPLTEGIVRYLTVEATEIDKLPTLDVSVFSSLEQLTAANTKTLAGLLENNLDAILDNSGLTLHCQALPSVRFNVEESSLSGDDGTIYRLLRAETATYTIPIGTKLLAAEACLDRENLQRLILPVDGRVTHLGENSLKGTGLTAIYYSSEEQRLTIEEELAQSGAPETVKVLPLQQTREGFTYTILEDGTAKLLRAPRGMIEYTGRADAEDGTALEVSTIGSGCFADSSRLQWVTLPKSTVTLEKNAFQNCTALQGLLMPTDGAVTLEEDCLNGCTALRFCAIGSSQITEAKTLSSTGTIPGRIWCMDTGTPMSAPWGTLRGCDGFAMVPVGEGRLLYATAGGENAILLGSSAVLPENVALDPAIHEIATDAFKNAKGENGGFTLNWEKLQNLIYIGENAFRNAELTGEVKLNTFGELLLSGRSFSETLITGVTTGDWTTLSFGTEVFWKCQNLREVSISAVSENDTMSYLLFGDCPSMEVLRFTGAYSDPPKLLIYASASAAPFYFGPESNENFHIEVPEGRQADYIRAWRFQMAGYTDYETMKKRLGCRDTGTSAQLEAELLGGIQRLCGLMGVNIPEKLTDFYPYTVDENGKTTLRGAPSSIESLSLSAAQLGMEDDTLDYIGTNAFSGCTALTALTLEEKLLGIYPGAFEGSGLKTLDFHTLSAPKLLCTEGEPFDFGVEDLRVTVPEGAENGFLMSWRCPMLGYEDEAALRAALARESAENLETRVEEALLKGENLVRGMLGMETTDTVTDDYLLDVEDYSFILVGVPKNLQELDLGVLAQELAAKGQSLSRIGTGAFQNAPDLKTVTVPELDWVPLEFDQNAFAGTSGVTLKILGANPPILCVNDDGTAYTFGGTGLTIQAENPQACLDSWKYPFAGYQSQSRFTSALLDESDFNTSRENMATVLLAGENAARAALGMSQVDEPSGFHYVMENYDFLTLEKAAWDTTVMHLDDYTLGMPDGWYLDYIGSGAFASCPELTQVVVPGTLVGISSGAFAQDTLILTFEGEVPPTLYVDYDGAFHWNVDNLTIQVPAGAEDAYLEAWKYQMSGATDLNDLISILWYSHMEWTDEELEAEALRLAGDNEAMLRKAMGLEPAEDLLEHFEYEEIRNGAGIRLKKVPTYVESITLDRETMGLAENRTLLEIDADSFKDCDLLKKVTVPATVDAITSKAFTCASESLTLDMTAWDKEKTPPKLVLLDMDRDGVKEPFSFGLTKENAQVTVLVQDEETKKNFVDAWAPAFAGAETQEELVNKLLESLLTEDMSQEDEKAAEALAETRAAEAIQAAKQKLDTLITVPTPPEEASSGELGEG